MNKTEPLGRLNHPMMKPRQLGNCRWCGSPLLRLPRNKKSAFLCPYCDIAHPGHEEETLV